MFWKNFKIGRENPGKLTVTEQEIERTEITETTEIEAEKFLRE